MKVTCHMCSLCLLKMSLNEKVASLATIRTATMDIYIYFFDFGKRVASRARHNDNWPAHMANLLIYIQHFFKYSPVPVPLIVPC